MHGAPPLDYPKLELMEFLGLHSRVAHAEQDIPETLDKARKRHPKEKIIYIWPFPAQNIAEFMNSQILRHN